MDFGTDNGQARGGVEAGRRLPELGQEQQSQQEGADDVDGDGGLVFLDLAVDAGGDAGILEQNVQTGQGVDPLGELLDGLVA